MVPASRLWPNEVVEAGSSLTSIATRSISPDVDPVSFVRIPRVKEISGLSKSTLRRWVKAGRFPRPVIEEGNTVMWDLAEVMRWRAEQFKKREERNAK